MKTKFFVAIIMALFASVNVNAQEVQREGSNFTAVKKEATRTPRVFEEHKTEYTYTDTKGTQYEVFTNKDGKAFIKKISKKTGKEYRVYVPEVGKQINPDAYVERPKEPSANNKK